MKIVIPGGSGQVGTILAKAFHTEGHEVVVLSRSPQQTPWKSVPWDGKRRGAWTAAGTWLSLPVSNLARRGG